MTEESAQASASGRVLPPALPSTACVRMRKPPGQSEAKRGKPLAGFAGQITAFLKAREWVQKRKCARRAALQMLWDDVIPTRLEIRDDEVEFFWLRS